MNKKKVNMNKLVLPVEEAATDCAKKNGAFETHSWFIAKESFLAGADWQVNQSEHISDYGLNSDSQGWHISRKGRRVASFDSHNEAALWLAKLRCSTTDLKPVKAINLKD